jgi:hypothetical protein
MTSKRLIGALAVTAACLLGGASAASAADVQQASSENWSGYVVGSSSESTNSFSSVSGSWVQPTAKCTGSQSYSAFWVGLGGSGQSDELEQAGTEADCSAQTASYFAWYELVPSAPVRLDLTIRPGDHISSQVRVSGSSVTVSLRDQTTGQSATRTLSMTDPDTSSAEWIAEAPSSCDQTGDCQPLSLTDFGTVNFAGASATADGHSGPISDPSWSAVAVQMSGSGSPADLDGARFASAESSGGATPSDLSGDGSSFSVTWSGGSVDTSTGSQYGYAGGGGGYGGYGAGGASGGYGAGGASGGYGAGGASGGYGAGGASGGYGAGGGGYGAYGGVGYSYGG